jgi:hypothetical protein
MDTTFPSISIDPSIPQWAHKEPRESEKTACCCGIEQYFSILIEEIISQVKVCAQKLNYFRKNGKQSWRKHLNNCLA